MSEKKEHIIEVDFTEEELEELTINAATLMTSVDRYSIDMILKGYVLAESLDAEEIHHISSNATPDQIINAQLDSALNQMILAMDVFEKFAEKLNYFTVLEMLQKRLDKDVSSCTTFSEFLFKEARKRGSKLN